jgi:hypothetical protein
LTRARLLAAVFTQMANTMQVGRGWGGKENKEGNWLEQQSNSVVQC